MMSINRNDLETGMEKIENAIKEMEEKRYAEDLHNVKKNNNDDLMKILQSNPRSKIDGKVYSGNLTTFQSVNVSCDSLKKLFPSGILKEIEDLTKEKIFYPRK